MKLRFGLILAALGLLGGTARATDLILPDPSPGVTAVSTFTLTAGWGTNSNATTFTLGAYTGYSDPPDSSQLAASSTTANTSAALSGLLANTTYYLWVSATEADQIGYTYLGSTVTLGGVNAPGGLPGITAVSSTTIATGWEFSTGASTFTLEASVSSANPPVTVAASSTTANTSALLGSLIPNTTYYVFVDACNNVYCSTYTQLDTSTSTLAASPIEAAFTGVTTSTVTANWTSGGNPSGTTYTVQISTDPGYGTFSSSTTLNTSATFAELSANTTYYAEVLALGNGGTSTPYTTLGSTATAALPGVVTPDRPYGIRGSLNSSGSVLTFSWDTVTRNADGSSVSPSSLLVGYNVYKRTSLTGTETRVNASTVSATSVTDTVNGQTYYYTVRTIESNGVAVIESTDSYTLASDTSLDTIVFLPDSISTLVIPGSANNLLLGSSNSFGADLKIVVTENSLSSDSSIIRDVQIDLARADTGLVVTTLSSFGTASATLNLAYNLSGNIPNILRDRSVQSSQLSLFYDDNGNFTDVSGTVNNLNQTISIKTAMLGRFQIRVPAGGRATTLGLPSINVFPRIITPNGDGINDVVYFVLNNPNNSAVTGVVYDRTGRFIANLTQSGGVGTTMSWDGKDANGIVVPTGGYFYIIQGEGIKFKGTVAVSR